MCWSQTVRRLFNRAAQDLSQAGHDARPIAVLLAAADKFEPVIAGDEALCWREVLRGVITNDNQRIKDLLAYYTTPYERRAASPPRDAELHIELHVELAFELTLMDGEREWRRRERNKGMRSTIPPTPHTSLDRRATSSGVPPLRRPDCGGRIAVVGQQLCLCGVR